MTSAFWPQILEVVKAGSLLIFDLGYTNFSVYAQLTAASVTWITRAKEQSGLSSRKVAAPYISVHDSVVWIGKGEDRQLIRLIEVLYQGKWYRYLTNELDPERLPAPYVVALYWQRWRIEDAYAIVKRLLGLAYFWVGSQKRCPAPALGNVASVCPSGRFDRCHRRDAERAVRGDIDREWSIAACTTSPPHMIGAKLSIPLPTWLRMPRGSVCSSVSVRNVDLLLSSCST